MLRLTRHAFTRKWRAGGIDIFRGGVCAAEEIPRPMAGDFQRTVQAQ